MQDIPRPLALIQGQKHSGSIGHSLDHLSLGNNVLEIKSIITV
jgi:hypothetical protein